MSKAIKWVVLKAASAAARNVPTLFFDLYYREVIKQIYDLTQDEEQTIIIARSLGQFSAEESAQRRKSVLRLFPKETEKLLTYLPLLWEIYFGSPIGEHKTEWTHNKTNNKIFNFIIKENPLIYGIGEDPENDNLPWEKLWGDGEGYLGFITGLLTFVFNFILTIKENDDRVDVKHTKSYLRSDNSFVLSCIIYHKSEYDPKLVDFSSITMKDPTKQKQDVAGDILEKITKYISIDKIEDLFESPTSGMQILLKTIVEKALHMEVKELLEHFTNYEEEFFKVLGWIIVHAINEGGRLSEKLFENEKIARLYGHIFRYLQNNAPRFLPLSLMKGFQDYFGEIYENMGGEEFVIRFRSFTSEQMLDFIFAGAKKGLKDLGVPFDDLKDTIYEEFQSLKPLNENEILNAQGEEKSKIEQKNLLMEDLFEQILLISTTILSIPAQLSFLLLYNALSSGNEIFVNAFHNIKDATDKSTEILDKMSALK